ncbi:MAG: LD-carboxypeptidase [Myxococcota bacterium]
MSSRPALIRPRPAPRGSTVGICAPAGPVDPQALERGVAWLESQGYRVRLARHLRQRQGYLAGRDAERRSDLLELVRAPEVRAIVAARAGYGTGRLLGGIDPAELRASRTAVIGYSDVTQLLVYLRERAGLASIHGPMLERSDLSEPARERWLALLRGEPAALAPMAGKRLRPGRARGPLVGGNLRTLVASVGTPWQPHLEGAVLFFEEVNEPPYALDRMLVQLRESGQLARVAGVAVGQLVDCESDRYPGVSARDVIDELLAPAVDGPIVVDLPFGHVADHHALGVGVTAEIDGDEGRLRMLEPVVESLGAEEGE